MVERIRKQALATAPLHERDPDLEVLDDDQDENEGTEANRVLIDENTIQVLARSQHLPREAALLDVDDCRMSTRI